MPKAAKRTDPALIAVADRHAELLRRIIERMEQPTGADADVIAMGDAVKAAARRAFPRPARSNREAGKQLDALTANLEAVVRLFLQ